MARCRVCVADDCIEAAAVLCEGLRLHDYDAVGVHTGTEALEMCRKGDIDLLLLDVCMPDMSGHEVCRQLKDDPKTRGITVIFVTVRNAAPDIALGFELGAADYITKPYNLPIVMVRVDAAMRAKNLQDQWRSEQEQLWEQSYTDTLTGLRNRRYLIERLQEEVEKAHRHNFPVSCVVFDVDEVRPLDEDLGPVSMDDLLAEVAMKIRNHSRSYDVIARYDGALFAAILPHLPLQDAVAYARKILQEVDTTTFSDPNFPTEAKMSVGVVSCQNGNACGAEYVLGEAMRGLLQAKSMPEDRVVARNLGD